MEILESQQQNSFLIPAKNSSMAKGAGAKGKVDPAIQAIKDKEHKGNSLHTSQSQIFSSLKILKLYRSEFPEWSVRWRAASEPETFCTRESKQKLCGTSMHKNDNFMFHNDIKDSVAILLYIPIDCTTH